MWTECFEILCYEGVWKLDLIPLILIREYRILQKSHVGNFRNVYDNHIHT